MPNDPLFALSLALVVAAVYLVVLRVIDLNEREPLWALGMALGLGAVAAAIAGAVVDPGFRELENVGEAVTAEGSKLVALALAVAALEGVSRLRGWSELNGPVDGLVYGAAVGLGYAVGEAFNRELLSGTDVGLSAGVSTLTLLWTTLLGGLSEGLFGAIIGAGFGLALAARAQVLRVVLPLVGALAAMAAHLGYAEFAQGNSLSGSFGRSLIATLFPLALVVLLMVYGLARERGAIAGELADEVDSGTVTEDELQRLRSPGARRAEYRSRIREGDFEGWLALRSLHNRQVQLALTERRSRKQKDPARRAELDAEAEHLRASIQEMKAGLHGASPVGEGAAA